VGSRIGVIAEPGDDLSTLEIPAEESAAPPPQKEASKLEPEKKSEPKAEAPPTPKPAASADEPVKKPSGPAKKQTYPLLPSVQHLIHEHGLAPSAIDKMTPTGPNNRLLKGDVLAYIGSISSSYPTELSAKIEKLTHLDLSHIKLAAPAAAPPKEAAAEPIAEAIVQDLEVAVPISMRAVIEVQKRIQSTLGVFMPLSTFIARATDVANDNLPRSKTQAASADELFSQVLGLDKIPRGARGAFLPQITALSGTVPVAKLPKRKEVDIIDILAGKSRPVSKGVAGRPLPGLSGEVNVFSVTVPKGEERRARLFLDRVKMVLEEEPGRLVL
jgi:hypothetical protein